MSGSPAETKSAFRRRMRSERLPMTSEERGRLSARVCERLREQGVWTTAGSVLLYFALPDELDLSALVDDALKAGKTVALPRFDPERNHYLAAVVLDPEADCRGGRFGIREPSAEAAILPLNQLDLVLVPGVAFDRCGHRLGRGKGFYDRLLEPVRGIKCGVAWDHQVDLEFPVEPHDVPMDCVVTPATWRSFGAGPVLK